MASWTSWESRASGEARKLATPCGEISPSAETPSEARGPPARAPLRLAARPRPGSPPQPPAGRSRTGFATPRAPLRPPPPPGGRPQPRPSRELRRHARRALRRLPPHRVDARDVRDVAGVPDALAEGLCVREALGAQGSCGRVATISIGFRTAYSKFSFRISSPARDSYFSGRTLASGMPTFMWVTG